MKLLYNPKKEPMRLACLMSGSGTNVRKLIEQSGTFKVVAIFTDNIDSNAEKIASEHNIAFLCNDIKEYCAKRNAKRSDMGIRKQFDAETRKFLQKNKVDAVALCGYMSLVTCEITDSFLTINVHPADLRRKGNDGKRLYAGMVGLPSVKAAILNGDKSIYSTVHIATSGLDEGPIILVSQPVKVDISKEERTNPEQLEKAAERNLESLKENGDWQVYPEAIKIIANGRVGIEGNAIFIDGKKYENGYCPSEEKEVIRTSMKEKRKKLTAKDVAEKSSAIIKQLVALPEFKNAKAIMFYSALPAEVQTKEAIKEAEAMGKKVLLPATNQNHISARCFTGFESLSKSACGILEPKGQEAKENIDVVVVPGLAFDKKGTRVGFGLGCYDEFLKQANCKKVGLCFEAQLADRLPFEEKDVPMDMVITEQRVIRVEKS